MLQNSISNLMVIPNQIFGPIQADIDLVGHHCPGWLFSGLFNGQSGRAIYERIQRVSGFTPSNYYGNYQNWSQTSLDTTLRTLKAAGLQGQQLQSEQGVLSSLRGMAQTSGGAMEALQVLGQISEQEVQQLMKLRELMLADLQSKQAFQAATIQQQANGEAAAQQFFQFGGATGDGLTFLPGLH